MKRAPRAVRKTRSGAAAKAPVETPAASREVLIDYPREGETVYTGGYTFRVGAVPEAIRVEVSLNGGPWIQCRESLGLWWHDWAGYAVGECAMVARIHKDRGIVVESSPRRFRVSAPAPRNPAP